MKFSTLMGPCARRMGFVVDFTGGNVGNSIRADQLYTN